jgi:hypothetical protein
VEDLRQLFDKAMTQAWETKDPDVLFVPYKAARRHCKWELCREIFAFWFNHLEAKNSVDQWWDKTFPFISKPEEVIDQTLWSVGYHGLLQEGLSRYVRTWTAGSRLLLQTGDPASILTALSLPISCHMVFLELDGRSYPGPRFPFPPEE